MTREDFIISVFGDNYDVVVYEKNKKECIFKTIDTALSLEEAVNRCVKYVSLGVTASAEVRGKSKEAIIDERVIFYSGPNDKNTAIINEYVALF